MKSEPVNCPGCKVELGQAVTIEGVEFLRIGILLVREARGLCIQCGKTVYWSVSDKAIERMIKTTPANGT